MSDYNELQYLNSRLSGLRQDRWSWWVHWQEIANYLLPRRYRWLIQPNQFNRGSPINQHIIDSTGTIAARVLASGMLSGITSPTRPWFKLRIDGIEDENHEANLWLAECERRMMIVFAESNFYTAMATMYLDLVVFGTAVVLIEEDYDDVIRCFNPCAGEYFVANNDKFRVNTIAREFVMTLDQLRQRFPNTLPETLKALLASGFNAAALATEYSVGHMIEPNVGTYKVPGTFKYRQTYWLLGNANNCVLEKRGYEEWPGLVPRWDLVANDAYGRSPGMDALPDVKQLQQETKRKAQALDKMVNPPLLADIQLKHQPASTLPGGVTFVQGLSNTSGMRPIYTVQPQIHDLKEDIAEIQNRIKTIFFNDLFQMISNLDTVRTATEIDARREEKLILLGPVLERLQNEGLDPAIDRTFNVMNRAGLLPPPPQGLAGHIQVQYVSMLAEAQKAVATASIERALSLAGNMAAVNPEIIDNVNMDDGWKIYAGLLNIDPRIVRDRQETEAIRAQRAKAQQQQQMLEQTPAAVKGAQVLSQTQLGGDSALDAVLGTLQ